MALLAVAASGAVPAEARPKRIVLIKADGVPGGVIERRASETDSRTGRSLLPWIDHVFLRGGARLRNFYVRGISLSASSWSMLDTGRHVVIRGNAEYDRATLRVYDYLNFFPFYFNNARNRRADMPSVEVLDEAGIPLLIDRYVTGERYQSPQLNQRGVTWLTLGRGARNRFTSRSPRRLFDEWQTGFEFAAAVNEQVERELMQRIAGDKVNYLDYFFGDYDHVLHLTNDEESLTEVLKELDGLVGRLWTAIGQSPRASDTILILLSDHGMNSDPAAYSQGFNLIRLFNSAEGGGHHVITNRHPLTEYKLRGLDPFVREVTTPSAESQYLDGQSESYPTALLDLDGNERASIHLRNNLLNRIHLELQRLARLAAGSRESEAVRAGILALIESRRSVWAQSLGEIDEELGALRRAVERQRGVVAALPTKFTREQKALELDAQPKRQRARLESMELDQRGYHAYREWLQRLLALRDADLAPGRTRVEQLIPPRVMGEANTVHDLFHYTAGPTTRIDYFALLTGARVRNNVQPGVDSRPVDFVAARLDPRGLDPELGAGATAAAFLYGDAEHQAIVLMREQDGGVAIHYLPVAGLAQSEGGALSFERRAWAAGYPLQIFEDPNLAVDGDRGAWLDRWHSDAEWLAATHRTQYSNGIVGLSEHFGSIRMGEPPAGGSAADAALLRRFALRKRRMVEADMLVLASNHWNFNVRGFNPGGNHGAFFRASTHSTLMLAGGGLPAGLAIDQPYDSLSFYPTVLRLTGLATGVQTSEYPGPVIEELLR